MRRLLAGALLTLAGCAAQPSRSFSYEGSDEGLRAAQLAAAQWNDACGTNLAVDRNIDGIPLVEVLEIPESPASRGVTEEDENGVALRVRFVQYEHAETTLAHEMGHVLGLGHLPTGLMEERGGTSVPRVTARECAALSAVEDP